MYAQSIEDLKIQNQLLVSAPKDVSLLSPGEIKEYVRCLFHYTAGRPQEISIHKGILCHSILYSRGSQFFLRRTNKFKEFF